MSRRILRDEDIRTERRSFPETGKTEGLDWVDLKSRFRARDRGAINQAIVSGKITSTQARGADGKTTQVVELGTLNLDATNVAWMVQGLVRWGGPGFCVINHDDPAAPVHHDDDENGPCKVLPMTIENIGNLDDASALYIVHWLKELNPEPVEGSDNP